MIKFASISAVTLCWFALSAGAAQTGPMPIDRQRTELNGATLRWTNDNAIVDFSPGANSRSVEFHSPDNVWDLSDSGHFEMAISNLGASDASVEVILSSKPANGKMLTNKATLDIAPGQTSIARMALVSDLTSTLRAKLWGMKRLPKELSPAQDSIDLSKTIGLTIKAADARPMTLKLAMPTLESASQSPTSLDAGFFPFIDQFGQYIHRDWPGKLKVESELPARASAEAQDLKANPGPSDWDQWGGWASGPKLNATGAFRTEKVNGKWWFVDPDGRLFFSVGADCVAASWSTPITGRDNWFADFPGNSPPLSQYLTTTLSVSAKSGQEPKQQYSFYEANLERKLGPDWKDLSPQLDATRMRSWGLNTIGNWSSATYYRLRKTPYVVNLEPRGAVTIKAYWEKFVDPYDLGYVDAVKRGIAAVPDTANDPWCLGYFVHNELAWGTDTTITQAMLGSPASQPGKQCFVQILKQKYTTIDNLNSAWNTHLDSWDALLNKPIWPDEKRAGDDLHALYRDFCRTYFRRTLQGIREAAPSRLYLGCRFAWSTETAQRAAAEFCDVVSWNCYTHSVAGYSLPKGCDKPLIIGEFHFGAEDRGLFGGGMQEVADQNARASAYKVYVTSAARNPIIVGVHWFSWRDEPVTGRSGDGENYQIGFLDVTDTPYPELIAASRIIGSSIYKLRTSE